MTSRLNITINAQDLLQKVLEVTAALREAFLQKEQAKQAQQDGDRQREALREQQGFDPVTRPGSASGSTPSASSSRASSSASRKFAERYKSRTPKFNDEPGIRRAPKGEFYVGVAWLEFVEDIGANNFTLRIGSGDASKWSQVTIPKAPPAPNYPNYTISDYEAAMVALDKPTWVDPGQIAQTDGGKLQWRFLTTINPEGGPESSLTVWFATPKLDEFYDQTIIDAIDVIPAGKDAAYIVHTYEETYEFGWAFSLYHGYRYDSVSQGTAVFADARFAMDSGSSSYNYRKVSVFYVTRTSSKLVQTPAWADNVYSLRKHGTTEVIPSSTTLKPRNPNDFYTALYNVSIMPEGGENDALLRYPPLGTWLNDEPEFAGVSTSSVQQIFPLPYNPGFSSIQSQFDSLSLPGGELFWLDGSHTGSPMEFYYGSNDYRGDASTPASRRAYKMVDYQYQADTENYSSQPDDPPYLNGFSLPTDSGLTTAQQVFDAAISARFLAFKSSGTKTKKSRSLFATDGSAMVNGDYASLMYFWDWENPSFCKSQLRKYGFSTTPPS